VACHCFAVGPWQRLFEWNGTTLRYVGDGNKIYYRLDLPGVTCTTTTTCYAVDPVGAVHTYS
jgi:hypothetical protein